MFLLTMILETTQHSSVHIACQKYSKRCHKSSGACHARCSFHFLDSIKQTIWNESFLKSTKNASSIFKKTKNFCVWLKWRFSLIKQWVVVKWKFPFFEKTFFAKNLSLILQVLKGWKSHHSTCFCFDTLILWFMIMSIKN